MSKRTGQRKVNIADLQSDSDDDSRSKLMRSIKQTARKKSKTSTRVCVYFIVSFVLFTLFCFILSN